MVQVNANLDTNTLDQYCDAIGPAILMKSVVLFEQMAPQYLQEIEAAINSEDKKAIIAEAHKFKGASGSVGLLRLQQLAQLMQCGDEPQWPTNYRIWFAEIQQHYDEDLQALKNYLNSK
nr:Hpt domain-containing protein [Ferrimonas senticii]